MGNLVKIYYAIKLNNGKELIRRVIGPLATAIKAIKADLGAYNICSVWAYNNGWADVTGDFK